MIARVRVFSRVLALIGFAGLLILALMTALDVALRWLLNAPLQGVNDISAVVMAVVISACIPANLAFKQNIRVDVLGLLGGPRFRALLEVVSSLATLVFIALIAWNFIPYTISLHETADRTWVLGWQVWPWWAVATAMMAVSVVVQAATLLVDLSDFLTGHRTGL